MIARSIAILFVLLSCNNKESRQNKSVISNDSTNAGNKEQLFDCIPADTVSDNFSVKYIKSDSFFSIKVEIGKSDTTLPYQFNCTVPPALIPTIYSSGNNIICLRRGYGQHFREFIVCYSMGDKIQFKEFEIAIDTYLKDDIVIYQNYDTLDQICFQNIKTDSKSVIYIPSKIVARRIYESRIKNRKLEITFSDDSKFTVPIPQLSDAFGQKVK